MSSRNRKLVPASRDALYQMKYEIAAELGLSVASPQSRSGDFSSEFAGELGEHAGGTAYVTKDDWGHISSRDVGYVGGNITRRLIQEAQRTLIQG
ncbi:alpha/beta-type small acid-soluble spore protein [Paenibacillus guangzhouensis]|uniref:alpha/beta-type small acid-soluble spore protein n=1 Tax=Paenibacillus guangzhouensis TaxID=1473112 RepID=UPI0012677F34|nr:alpha/beta-type small acid-soluble spore protein [Paenibacillus guangzhouensis]